MGKVIVEKKNIGSHNILYEIREEGKSNFVSDKSLVNPIIEDFKKRDINFPRVFGVPRSGSTLIRNILNTMFDGRVKVQSHNYFSVNKPNDLVPTDLSIIDASGGTQALERVVLIPGGETESPY